MDALATVFEYYTQSLNQEKNNFISSKIWDEINVSLSRLYKRNEFYIASKHPLGETIVNQTGKTPLERRRFLQNQYDLSLNLSIQKWKPKIELLPLF